MRESNGVLSTRERGNRINFLKEGGVAIRITSIEPLHLPLFIHLPTVFAPLHPAHSIKFVLSSHYHDTCKQQLDLHCIIGTPQHTL